ncbi:uncharacterized protein LOC110684765 [Chenopodium quinoa]|uniref:uncharacterized protein LOC110684765 n=1 Tax=Chenopodium quinoa TaxID=63459 RepID=UPI000B79054F|nr:uncharacterized protein LOC110684765 [Chenopodium quinoa]
MKREVAESVSKCLMCQKVKIDHKRPMGKVQPLEIPGWKWDSISMDFVTGLPKTRTGNDTIMVIVDRLTKSAMFIPIKETWKKKQLASVYVKNIVRLHGVPKDIVSDRESSERVTLGTDFIEDMVGKVKLIQSRIKAAQDRQKSYADLKMRDDEFNVGDKVFLKVSPTKGKVAYKLALPMEFEKMHDVFHISQLKKYVPSETHVLQPEAIQLDESLTYEERLIKRLDHKVRSTRNKDVKIVKVLWSNQEYEEATWEAEEEMKNKYPEFV